MSQQAEHEAVKSVLANLLLAYESLEKEHTSVKEQCAATLSEVADQLNRVMPKQIFSLLELESV